MGGLACPLGAHYLPLPGDDAHEVQDLLEELGLRQRVAGRWVYDERHLCHSPQDRLFFNGQWQEGLLPLEGVGPATLAQYLPQTDHIQFADCPGRHQPGTGELPLAQIFALLDELGYTGWCAAEYKPATSTAESLSWLASWRLFFRLLRCSTIKNQLLAAVVRRKRLPSVINFHRMRPFLIC